MTTKDFIARNERFRHGSAHWASERELKREGYFTRTAQSVHIGFAYGRAIYWNGDSGGLINAGPRSGKFTGVIGFAACTGFSQNNQVFLDVKSEIAMVGRDQTAEMRPCYFWAPHKRFCRPQHNIDLMSHITLDSPTLIADITLQFENSLPESGGGNAKFFELSAQRLCKSIGLSGVESEGAFSFRTFKNNLDLLLQDNEETDALIDRMSASRFADVRAAAGEIANGIASGSNAFLSVVAEAQNAFRCLSDPDLLSSISPPFHLTLEEFCDSEGANLYLMPLPDFVKSWAPVIRIFLGNLKLLKSRRPNARKQDWWIDEAPLLAPFPLLAEVLNLGAGQGVRAFIVTQSFKQMKSIVTDGDTLLPAGAGMQIYFGVRDDETASRLSKAIGSETLYFDDDLKRSEAALQTKQTIRRLLAGGDPLKLGMEYAHHKRASQHRSQQERPLIRPDEIRHLPRGKAIIFLDGLSGPVLADLIAYFENRPMTGRFQSNPHHAPKGMDKVRVKTRLGHAWWTVREKPAPPQFAHLPQYADAPYTVVEA
ncbi:type IV secretory system conjugative DNA transfer family protein [Novosphingobium beihaiensis]|uniref:Type IV secretory system conjugative DNA transfer family protein n=1 Tax=Novosphingobium beihaiensis TaxID=2930389 RepID=A0ABT0BMG6_9SPHN|nr:type IV secretory system conjugative DNA transfer family protein [Novosphingobium beihaiensis]MCJ2186245.1 type IV secretory system conjugative DNA transfer family protein [Novosphingobium beihaiensis]